MSATWPCPMRGSTRWRRSRNSAQIIPTRITFVDIAGLVRGASKGEGLGNQFLANIREVDAVAHVLRCFEDDDITHVEGRIDPVGDAETVETELMLADLESLERRVIADRKEGQGRREGGERTARADDEGARAAARRQARAPRRPDAGGTRALSPAGPHDRRSRCSMCAMSTKARRRPATNIRRRSKRWPRREGAGCVVISARIEEEMAQLADRRNATISCQAWASKNQASIG